jgi:RHS repeat-associated protein
VATWSATSLSVGVPTGATSGTFAVTVAGATVNSQTFTVSTLPIGWLDQDIAASNPPGTANYSNGVFTLHNAGSGFGGGATGEAFHFAYQALTGDGTIVARVASVSDSTAQAGVLIRETLDPGAKNMFMSYSNGAMWLYYRTATGSAGSAVAAGTTNVPYWTKVSRSGSLLTGYISSDGVNWTKAGASQSINMAQTVYIGLGEVGGNNDFSGAFDNVSLNSTANPAPIITSVSATTASVGSQIVITGQNFGATQGNSVVLLHGAATTINSWSATSITITIPAGATSGYLAVSVAPSMNDSNPIDFTVTTNPLPQNWLDQDVGYVGVAGSASYTNGVFSIVGGGNAVSGDNSQDGFHFVYRTLTGDGTIIARLRSIDDVTHWGGLMVRDSLSGGAESIFICQCNGGGSELQYRTATGTSISQITTGNGFLPTWFKLVRIGSDFLAYLSTDGISWQIYGGTIPIPMSQTLYIGVAVSSDRLSTSVTATFDSVSISSSTNSVPVISSLSATTGPVGTPVIVGGSGFGTTQGSGTVTLNNAPVTVNLWSDTSIAVTIPSGATSGAIVVLKAPDMDSSNPVTFTVTTNPLPSGWFDADINAGRLWHAGSASYSSGVYTVNGSGLNGSGGDGLHFVYQPVSTDFTLIARVASLATNSRAGVMMRETLDGYSPSAVVYTYAIGNPPYAAEFDSRAISGGPVSSPNIGVNAPGWVKLVRSTNTFSGYYSLDGTTWTQVGTTKTIQCGQTVLVGLEVSAGGSASGTATFDNVSITPGSSLPNPTITGLLPASGAPGTQVAFSGSGFGATQGASTVYFNGAPATSISSWSDAQIQAIVPDGATTGSVSAVVSNITGNGPNFTVVFAVTLTDSLTHTTNYSSSVFGGQWSFTNAQGSGCSSCTTRGNVQQQYDGQGNLAWTVDALGHVIVNRYDSSNNLISQAAQGDTSTPAAETTYSNYNSFGEPQTVKDPLGNITTNTYDIHGNLKTVTTPKPNVSTNASVTQFNYNTVGELTSIVDPLLNTTTIAYTPTGLIQTITDMQSNVTTYGYDSHGNRTSVTDALNHQTTFAYDAMDRLTTITYPNPQGPGLSSVTTTFGYDYRGRRTSVTDQNGKMTTYAYDDADRLTSVTDAASPANHVTIYAYDTENNLTSITDANQNQTVFVYDQFGRVKQTNFPSSNVETYGYDADNNLISKTDRKGQTIQYVYDALNRLTRKFYQDSTEVDYVYDLVGKIQQVNDPTGTYALAYDNMGRLIGTTTNYSFLPSRPFTTSYAYDAASNRTGFTDPESGSTSFAYDTLNRLQTLTPPVAITSGSFGFGYDALSRRISLTRPNSVTTNYAFDNLSRLTSVLHQLSGSTIDGAAYTVDNAGNRTAKTDQRAAVTTNYGYDNIYQLLSAVQGANTTESYGYDPVGNRLSSLGVASYTNNTSNELTATSLATYGYDNNGNTLTKTDSTGPTNYTWDFENRLTSVTLPAGGGTVSFKYDPFGRRIYKSSSSGTSVFAYDGDNLIEETNAAGAVVARYSQGLNIDEPLAMLRSSATSFYHADGLGSITSLANAAGALAQTYTFDSFGKQTATSGSLVNPFQYTGRESDSETGLYYYRARYYDPQTGRFLNEDPTRYAGGNVNFYPYASNAPTRLIDPVGLATVTNNTGSPILVWGNPGAGHGTSGGNVYGVIPPDGKLYGGGDNPIKSYATPQEAVDAYYRNGPTPKPAGNLLDVDFYSPTPLAPNAPAPCITDNPQKIIGDDKGPHYTLKKDKNGKIVDSYNRLEYPPAAFRRIVDDINDYIDQHAPWIRYTPLYWPQ